MRSVRWIKEIRFDEKGLVPALIQDARSKELLMVAYMNEEAVRKTLSTGKTHFYSRSRKRMWLKGETSGHIQRVRKIFLDCDGDALLVQVSQAGGACHEGYRSCFFRRLNARAGRWRTAGRKVFDPKKVYGPSESR
ncbi:MAG: phosphoribosyl-AMP cyclohydrolase [Candidatus Omnitrophica bacterium]|nr:phosphoribosyl-AMP cyclohydrolase [Candidatus Omnitrophota bacterium]